MKSPVVLKADVKRYGSIAKRWPPTIILPDCTPEQLEYLLTHGLFEAGCDDLFVNEDDPNG